MAVTSARQSSCGSEHTNHAHPVGPGAPCPVRLISRGLGSPGDLAGFTQWQKFLHANQITPICFPGLIRSCFDLYPWGGTLKLSLKQQLVTVKADAWRDRQPQIYFWRVQFPCKRASFKFSGALFLPGCTWGQKYAVVHLASQIPLAGLCPQQVTWQTGSKEH